MDDDYVIVRWLTPDQGVPCAEVVDRRGRHVWVSVRRAFTHGDALDATIRAALNSRAGHPPKPIGV